jgi:hypothetical protein
MNWDRVKGFSASLSSYPKIDLRSFLACHMSKIFLAMRGTPPPSNPPNRRGHIPLLATPWCNISMGDVAEKQATFLTTFLKRKTVFQGLNRTFFSLFEASKGRKQKVSKHAYVREKVKLYLIRVFFFFAIRKKKVWKYAMITYYDLMQSTFCNFNK